MKKSVNYAFGFLQIVAISYEHGSRWSWVTFEFINGSITASLNYTTNYIIGLICVSTATTILILYIKSGTN